jgi:hypothetical protein
VAGNREASGQHATGITTARPDAPGAIRCPFLIPIACSYGDHRGLGVVDSRPGAPRPPVDIDEHAHCDPSCALVAVGQRVVARKADEQHGCLVDEVGIEVGIAEACRRGCSAESARFSLVTLMTVSMSSR